MGQLSDWTVNKFLVLYLCASYLKSFIVVINNFASAFPNQRLNIFR